MATTTKKSTTTHTKLDSPYDPYADVNEARASRGQPLVTDGERKIALRRQQVYEKCEFNRRIQRLLALLTRAHRELEEFADLDEQAVITEAWANAGLPPLDESNDMDEESAKLLAIASHVSRAAQGCEWALEQFTNILEGVVVG